MSRRSNFPENDTIDVQGVLGTFKVPHADLTVEYILTYASLDGTPNNRLLDLLVPVREVFSIKDLDFDHLLQRDLDDYRVSEEMVPYLLGKMPSGETFSDPRFFPPIVAIIVPTNGKSMNELYPKCKKDKEKDQGVQLRIFDYDGVFSVKREAKNIDTKDEELAQSPVDLCINPTNAKLVIVDGQHRAMAMLAAYRSVQNKWNGNEFKYLYDEIDLDISILDQIHLPVCIAYFPELTSDIQKEVGRDLTTACRKIFLDVNKNARQPSQAREILLNDTDLVACFTRHLFNMVKKNAETNMLQLHHTEYDNPHNQISVTRPFALTNVRTIFDIIRFVLLSSDNSILTPTARYYSGRSSENNERLRRELDLDNILTEEEKELFEIGISDIELNSYPRQGETKFRECFEDGWGQVIFNSLSKFYPFSKHIKAVDTVLKAGRPYMGENKIAHTALVEGQGLRHILDEKQKSHKSSSSNGNEEKSDVQKAWEVLRTMEENVKKIRAKLYLELGAEPNDKQIKMVDSMYDCFCSNAFQTGLFMAFAYLKARIGIEDPQEFIQRADKWISYINNRFQSFEGVRSVLFNHSNSKSLRYIFKPDGGLTPSHGHFCRYLIIELLSGHADEEEASIREAQEKWRTKLYTTRHDYRKKITSPPIDDNDSENFENDLHKETTKDVVEAFKNSLDIDEMEIKRDLKEIRQKLSDSKSEVEDEDEVDEMDDLSETQ